MNSWRDRPNSPCFQAGHHDTIPVMNLYRIDATHYSQKDSFEGIVCYCAAPDDRTLVSYIVGPDLMWADLDDPEEYYLGTDDATRAHALGYQLNDYDELSGTVADLILICGIDTREVSDLYYGATRYGWSLVQADISATDLAVLSRLGILEEIPSGTPSAWPA